MSVHTHEAIALIHNRPGFAREVARQLGFTHVGEAKSRPILSGFGLTAKQWELLDFIRAYQAENNISPSFDEMKDAVGLVSKSGVFRLVTALEERGHIMRIPNRARCIVLREAE